MVHRCASFRQKTDLDEAQSLYHESGNSPFHYNPRRPTRSRVVVQRYQAQNRDKETEAPPE
jgi:hypothetical protein